jgi:hypothetical protein
LSGKLLFNVSRSWRLAIPCPEIVLSALMRDLMLRRLAELVTAAQVLDEASIENRGRRGLLR